MQTLTSEYGRPPLEVDDLVPTVMLRYHLGSVHVGTPTRAVLRETRDAIRKQRDARWTRDLRKQTLAAAAWIHAENLALYQYVMGGH